MNTYSHGSPKSVCIQHSVSGLKEHLQSRKPKVLVNWECFVEYFAVCRWMRWRRWGRKLFKLDLYLYLLIPFVVNFDVSLVCFLRSISLSLLFFAICYFWEHKGGISLMFDICSIWSTLSDVYSFFLPWTMSISLLQNALLSHLRETSFSISSMI